MSRQHKSKLIENDLYRSQKTCSQLDQSKGYTEPVETWFWPQTNDETDNTGSDNESYDEPVTENERLSDEEEEPSLVEITDQEDIPKASKCNSFEHSDEVEFMPQEQLQMITEYLRSQYYYCLWCGITFTDCEDMVSTCPGPTREDHDE